MGSAGKSSKRFTSRPSKDLPLSMSRNNFPAACGEEEYSM